jgi:hypothetical protein
LAVLKVLRVLKVQLEQLVLWELLELRVLLDLLVLPEQLVLLVLPVQIVRFRVLRVHKVLQAHLLTKDYIKSCRYGI